MRLVELGDCGGAFLGFPLLSHSRIACGGVLDFGIYGTVGRRCQADARARCGGVSDFGTYRDTILYLFT